MRKAKILISALAIALLGLATASCEREITFESTNSRVMEQTIYWNQWQPDDINNPSYLYVTLDWDAISTDVLNYGTVSAYVYDGDRQNPLPYLYPMGQVTYEDGNVDYLVENIRFDLEPGKITFIMQDLDGNLPEGLENTAPLVFRAVATVPVQYVIN